MWFFVDRLLGLDSVGIIEKMVDASIVSVDYVDSYNTRESHAVTNAMWDADNRGFRVPDQRPLRSLVQIKRETLELHHEGFFRPLAPDWASRAGVSRLHC